MRGDVKYRADLRRLSPQARQQIDQDIARLSASLAAGRPVRLRLGDDQGTESTLPVSTVELIREALALERDGKGFLLLAEDAEVSLGEAAAMLCLSRPTLLKKLDGGDIPFHGVGSNKRVAVADVLAYRREQKKRAQAVLQQMRDEADDAGLYE